MHVPIIVMALHFIPTFRVQLIPVIEFVMVKCFIIIMTLYMMYMHHYNNYYHAYNNIIEPPRAMILHPDDRLKCLYSHSLMTQTCKINNNLCNHCNYWKATLCTLREPPAPAPSWRRERPPQSRFYEAVWGPPPWMLSIDAASPSHH